MYILRCSDGTLYVGHTDDLERRVAQHESGELGGYTALRKPVALVFSEEFPSRDDALTRERQVKNWSRAKKEALVAGDWRSLSRLARGPDKSPAENAAPSMRRPLRVKQHFCSRHCRVVIVREPFSQRDHVGNDTREDPGCLASIRTRRGARGPGAHWGTYRLGAAISTSSLKSQGALAVTRTGRFWDVRECHYLRGCAAQILNWWFLFFVFLFPQCRYAAS